MNDFIKGLLLLCENQPFARKEQNFDTEEGKERRLLKLTSSDVFPKMLGMPKAYGSYSNLLKQWKDPNFVAVEPLEFQQKIFDYGKETEVVVLMLLKHYKPNEYKNLVHNLGTWSKKIGDHELFASPDALVYKMNSFHLIEVKTKIPWLGTSQIPSCKDEIPPQYMAQMFAQCYTTGIKKNELVYFSEKFCQLGIFRFNVTDLKEEQIVSKIIELLDLAASFEIEKIPSRQPKCVTEKGNELMQLFLTLFTSTEIIHVDREVFDKMKQQSLNL